MSITIKKIVTKVELNKPLISSRNKIRKYNRVARVPKELRRHARGHKHPNLPRYMRQENCFVFDCAAHGAPPQYDAAGW